MSDQSDQKVAGYAEVTGRVREGRLPRRKLVIDASGAIRGLYDDSLVGLGEIEKVTRASHVEWSDGLGNIPKGWYVAVVDNPHSFSLGGLMICEGLATRAEALAFEVQWLQENRLK